MTKAYLSLGSNLGNRRRNLEQALGRISRLPRTRLVRSSSLYRTSPVLPFASSRQDHYYNLVAEIETGLRPEKLLENLLSIERELGRVRRGKNQPREIDLDIIYYGRQILRRKRLMLPHPRAAERRFVLAPLCELAPGFVDPVRKKTVSELLAQAPGDQKIRRFSRRLKTI